MNRISFIRRNPRAAWLCAVLAACFLVLLTRGITLTYSMELHPDEHVFFVNTENLLHALMNPETEYVENKEYPEGAYLYHLPFFFAGKVLQRVFGIVFNARLWSRISSVCYFTLAVVLGMHILRRHLRGNLCSLILYGLTMVFSLFFIEHSRYGVGDMISVFLLLLTIVLTAAAFSGTGTKWKYLIAAFFICGTLGAVKWPQLFFLCIPAGAYWHSALKHPVKKTLLRLFLLLMAALTAFLMFSPKACTDFSYFVRAARREVLTYAVQGKAYEDGGLLNHIAQLVIYNCLYSDFPFALFFFLIPVCSACRRLRSALRGGSTQDVLIHVIVPIACAVFFLYNMFIRMMVFRTYTPYFAISTIYVAKAASRYFTQKKWQRGVMLALTAVMVVRGSYMIAVLSNDDKVQEHIQTSIENSVNENWNRTILINSYIVPFDTSGLVNPVTMRIDSMEDFEERGIEMAEGDLVITGGYEYGLGGEYLFPVHGDTASSRNDAYAAFKEANSSYWKAQAYPDFYYLLFGGWIRGGSLSTFTMPCNYIYYRN